MGFLTKKKTIVDMNFIELFTPDAALRQAKIDTFYTTNSMGEFNEKFFRWKKDKRGRYKERYLERAGLEPQTNAVILKVDNTLLLDYLKINFPSANEIISKTFRIPSIDYVARDYMQDTYPSWSNYSDTVNIDGITYKMLDVEYSDPEDDTLLSVVLENTTDDTDTLEINLTNTYHATTCINVRYETNTSATEWYVYIESKETLSTELYTEDDLTMSAIIPLKENNVMHEDDLWVKRMLNRLGVGGGELTDQLVTETNIDNAYIFTGLKFNDENQYVAKALYQTFEHIYNASIPEPETEDIETEDGTFTFVVPSVTEKINFAMSEMNLTYDFDMKIEVMDGVAPRYFSELGADAEVLYKIEPLKVGDYCSILNESSSMWSEHATEETSDSSLFSRLKSLVSNSFTSINSELKIRYQVSPNTYLEMTISNYVNTFTISGYNFTAYLNSSEEDGRLILPLEVMNKLKFKEWIEVHDRSFTLLAYSHQVVKIYWYEQSWFSWVIRIGLAFITGGASLTMDFFIDLLVSYAISLAINEILQMIDPGILMMLASVVLGAIGASFTSGFDITDFTVENYLPLATKSIQTASNIYAQAVQADIAKLNEKTEEQERRDELLDEELNSGFSVTKAMMDAHYSYGSMNNPDAWIAQQLGFGLFNYDQYFSVTNNLDIRVNVVSG